MELQQPPIDKRCRICKEKKLLNQFEINNRAKDKRSNICKDCLTEKITCQGCIDNKIIETAHPIIDLLLTLVEDGIELPERLVEKIGNLALLSGMTVYCDDCNKEM
ncbi:MAG: hypothetical protein WCC17_07895 [Candidatus Nitrosopolaris sp.]|jgi:hypothetical protein